VCRVATLPGTSQGVLSDSAPIGADRGTGPGHIYVVEPTGPFEVDPNVTNRRFPGNATRSYRTRHAMHVIEAVSVWKGHAPESLQAMLDNLSRLGDVGLDLIED
jgi:hypothetical protein